MRSFSHLAIGVFVIVISVAAVRASDTPLQRLRIPSPTAVAGAPIATVTATRPPTRAEATAAARATAPAATPANLSPLPSSQLGPRIDQLLTNVPAHVGLIVEQPDGTMLAQHNPSTQFEAASLYKLPIMVEVYRQRQAGTLSFDDKVTLYPGFFTEPDPVYGDANVKDQVTIRELLTNMITVSSNVAANALLYVVGTGHVNATMTDLGLNDTEIRWSPKVSDAAPVPGQLRPPLAALPATLKNPTVGGAPEASPDDAWNVTSPRDMARLFQLLLSGKVVTAQASREMLDLLAQQQINDRLPAGLPPGTRVAHKTGNVDDVIHDAGVIYGPKGPVIVVAMSDNVDNQDDVVDFMVQLGRLAYQTTQ